jgi:hypothetical protein
MSEKRVISETGGEKGTKPSQLAWLPPDAMLALGEVAGHGSEKYTPHNFRLGYNFSLSLNALYRHALAFQGGEDLDPDSGLPHMAHAAWHALNLVQSQKDYGIRFDDRWSWLDHVRLTKEEGPNETC